MTRRASWKGVLRVADLICPVSLFAAASTSDRIVFHTLNRKTGHRVQRQFVDSETGRPVDAEEQVKGYETPEGDFVVLEPEEIEAAIPDSDKTLDVQAFVACGDIDTLYFDRPYYLAPSTLAATEGFALLRDGMRAREVVALARTVLFRRMRTVLVRACGDGLAATTLNFDYEVKSAQEAFSEIPKIRIESEMLDLARHIIKTKMGTFDPGDFDDRYDSALAELVKSKLEGRTIRPPKPRPLTKVVDLMEALRQSAKPDPARRRKPRGTKASAGPAPRRKAG